MTRTVDWSGAEQGPQSGIDSSQASPAGRMAEAVADHVPEALTEREPEDHGEERQQGGLDARLLGKGSGDPGSERDPAQKPQETASELEYLSQQAPAPAAMGCEDRHDHDDQVGDAQPHWVSPLQSRSSTPGWSGRRRAGMRPRTRSRGCRRSAWRRDDLLAGERRETDPRRRCGAMKARRGPG